MRALVAVVLTAAFLALAGAPHVHDAVHGDHDCPACLARTVDPARTETPDVAPRMARWVEAAPASFEPVPAGVPQGAVPGQSPPVIA